MVTAEMKCVKCSVRVWYEKGLLQCECIEIEMAHLEHGLATYPPEWQEATDTIEDEHLLIWWLSSEDCDQLAGVIVIWQHHAPFIERLPGFITDTQLRLFVCGKPVGWPERK